MGKVLISFLGRKSYAKARYAFSDVDSRETSFFADVLIEHLRGGQGGLDRLVMLGTAASMWSELALELGQATPADGYDGLFDRLSRPDGSLAPADLSALGDALCLRYGLREVTLALIPYGRDPAEIREIVERIADNVRPRDRVVLDVTHGFRHLPMLAYSAASVLTTRYRGDSRVRFDGIYYGALEMAERGHPAPVLRLDQLVELLDWVRAVTVLDATGDAAQLGRLMEAEGGPLIAAEIADAGWRERILDTEAARDGTRRARGLLPALKGMGRLFAAQLEQRFAWIDEPTLSGRQLALARQRRRYGALLDAAILYQEAAVSRSMERNGEDGDLRSYDARNREKDRLRNRQPAFRLLSTLRNAMAHSNPDASSRRSRRILSDRQELDDQLRSIDGALFPQGEM